MNNKNALFISAISLLQAYLDNVWVGLDLMQPGPPDIIHTDSPKDYKDYNSDFVVLDFMGIVEKYGYKASRIPLTTADGYHLVMHRITGTSLSSNVGKPVVFLQHGLFGSSDSFVFMGPNISLAFQLADAGYDVFLGNVRGNTYSRSHATFDPVKQYKHFWEFTMHEMAIYDLTAMIDSALILSRAPSLVYIGYSMGTNLGNILLSHKPNYNKKVNLMINLSPTIFFENNNSTLMNFVKEQFDVVTDRLFEHKVYELLPQCKLTFFLGKILCKDEKILPGCKKLIGHLTNIDTLDYPKIAKIASYMPSGTSFFALTNFLQLVYSGGFKAFDYGDDAINIKHYKQNSSITYDLANVQSPTAILYGRKDSFTDVKDVKLFRNKLQNVVYCRSIANSNFNHFDFVTSNSAKELVNDKVLNVIDYFSYPAGYPYVSVKPPKLFEDVNICL